MSNRELDVLYNNIDRNHDGHVDFDEFVDFICGCPPSTAAKAQVVSVY